MENILDQLDRQMAGGAEASPFYQPIRDLPADFAASDRERLANAYRAMIGDRVFGAYRKLQDFIRTEYLAACRDGKPGQAVRNPVLYDQGSPSITRLPPMISASWTMILPGS